MRSKAIFLLSFTCFDLVFCQFNNWVDHQVNTTICVWSQVRAALIRDTVYLDGGSIWWLPGLDSGKSGAVANQGNFEGIILTYNLSIPLTQDTNVTGILLKDRISKARGGSGNNNGGASNYLDGALLANDAEFFMYGGELLQNDDIYSPPAADEVLGYQAFQYGVDKPLWRKGFIDAKLDAGVTRYVTNGGATSAPSENKAWYFSGLTSRSRGPIYENSGVNGSSSATEVSNTLVALDMSIQYKEKWTNLTLPSHIQGRANPELVWVPVGKEGILIVLGGVVYPQWAGAVTHISDDADTNKKQSPEFMRTIDIYDIAGDKWYQQPTDNGPSARTRGCAVVAPATDGSSYNIYYYGGFDGINVKSEFYDEVWVLSLPSFTWTKLHSGTSTHGRAGHKCFLPYPDQMMIVGGYTPLTGNTLTCLEDGPVIFFNITSGDWMHGYDPAEHGQYGVPTAVQSAIGGTHTGGAAQLSPVSSGWSTNDLGSIFSTRYNMSKIPKYWPYEPAEATGRPDAPLQKQDGKVPDWVPPVLGAVLGLVLLTGLILAFCLWRRKVAFRGRANSPVPSDTPSQIFRWVMGQQYGKAKNPPSSTDVSPSNIDLARVKSADLTIISTSLSDVHEMDDTQVAELDDTSPRAEMEETCLTPVEAAHGHRVMAPLLTNFKSFSSLDSSIQSALNQQSSFSDLTPTVEFPAKAIYPPNLYSAVSDESLRSALPIVSPSDLISPLAVDQESPILPVSPPLDSQSGTDYISSGRGSPGQSSPLGER